MSAIMIFSLLIQTFFFSLIRYGAINFKINIVPQIPLYYDP